MNLCKDLHILKENSFHLSWRTYFSGKIKTNTNSWVEIRWSSTDGIPLMQLWTYKTSKKPPEGPLHVSKNKSIDEYMKVNGRMNNYMSLFNDKWFGLWPNEIVCATLKVSQNRPIETTACMKRQPLIRRMLIDGNGFTSLPLQ